MQRLRAALIRLRTDLVACRADWALVGGLAVSAQAEPRTTRDLDVVVSVSDDVRLESVGRFLLNHGYREVEHRENRRLGTAAKISYRVPGESSAGVVADLLFAMTGIEPEVVAAAEVLEVMRGLAMPVARTGHLLALKVLARDPSYPDLRPQDAGDIRELLRVADREEVQRARHALDLMMRRGFDLDIDDQPRDLRAEFEDLLMTYGTGRGGR